MEPPREDLIRAVYPGYELRDAQSDGGMPTLSGAINVFGEWAEINSNYEGHFLERFAPGSLTKTFSENRGNMKVLFQHGQDPQVGDKVLGPIELLEEQGSRAVYEVPLLDTSYNRDLLPGLQAGLYGTSFRFKVMKEDLVKKPEASSFNPDRLPERTVTEARLYEFGPVTFPAYASSDAGVRSLTDEWRSNDKLLRLAELLKDIPPEPQHSNEEPEPEEPEVPEPATPSMSRSTQRDYLHSKKEKPSWQL